MIIDINMEKKNNGILYWKPYKQFNLSYIDKYKNLVIPMQKDDNTIVFVKVELIPSLLTEPTLWAWGLNNSGQIGNNTFKNQDIPLLINSNHCLDIACGYYCSLSIKLDGSLWAWGDNTFGQLGDGTNIDKQVPTLIDDGPWKFVSGGLNHCLGVKLDGSLWSWGYNNYGQLGDGTYNPKLIPTLIDNGPWKLISAGNSISLGIKTDKTLWSWGNYIGCGIENVNNDVLIPTQIGSDKWNHAVIGTNSRSLGIK